MSQGKGNLRGWVFGQWVVLAILLALIYGQVTTAFDAAGSWRCILSMALGVCCFGLVLCWPRMRPRTEVVLLMILAAALRVALLPAAPSDDIHRYLWEGKLVANGVSPYAAPASDPRYEGYRDAQWAQMNHLDSPTAYPPGAELVFALLTKVSYSPAWFKAFFALMDLGVVALILLALKHRRLPLRWVGWYAFNPITLIAFAGEGHFDVLMVFPLMVAVVSVDHGRRYQAAGCLALAVQMKIFAVLALPFLLRRIGWRWLISFAVILFLVSARFLNDLDSMFGGLLQFGSGMNFNGFVYQLLLDAFNSRPIANGIVAVCFGSLLLWRWLRPRRGGWELDWFFVIGALLVLSPTVHFWYLTWLLPFVALRPSASWLGLSVTMGVYFLVWRNFSDGGDWALGMPQLVFIWVPFLLVGLWELLAFRRQASQAGPDCVAGVSVVIPVLNAEEYLADCIQALRASTEPADEIIVVDGGSTDNTRALAKELECKVIDAGLGRGQQIAAGLKAAKFRYLLTLHADCLITPTALASVRVVFKKNTDVVGGALGQRFNEQSPMLLLIEALNELRATMGGVAFGDQVQFFDRHALADADYPAQPLMEDVELSLRLRARGRLVYLGDEVISASAKWQKVGSWARIRLVLRFVLQYRWARWQSLEKAEALSHRLYREYYSN